MAKNVSIKLDDRVWRKFIARLKRDSLPPRVAKQWIVRYSAFVRRRFTRQGDGEWKSLKPDTIRKRRGSSAKILRDTSTLLNALQIGKAHYRKKPHSVEYGFPNAPHKSSGVNIRQLAIWHQTGAGNLPKREILVEPNQRLVKSMQGDLMRYIQRFGERLGGIARGK